MLNNLNSIYEEYIYSQAKDSSNIDLTEKFWGKLPKNLQQIDEFITSNINKTRGSDKNRIDEQEALYKIFFNFHKKYNFFTPQIQNLLENWFDSFGSIECGHQPIYLGGPSFLLNKVHYTSYLYNNLKIGKRLTPIFFIGDHDEIQNELIITRFPQAHSPHGLELKSEYEEDFFLTPMYRLPKPNLENLLDHLDKIKQNYKELFKFSKIKSEIRPLLESRLESSIGTIYESYFKSGPSYSDWITELLGNILLFKNKLPILMVPGSDLQLRKILLPYLENLLVESNRIKLITILNEYNISIENAGFKPGISFRDKQYVPFFLECPKDKTRDRIRLSTDGDTLSGICPKCREEYSISYDKINPDLSEYAEFLSPRVDSRSISVNQLLKSYIRVTGGGETSYYAQILPYLKEININPTPLIIKHPRVYYNTPWFEKKGEELKEELNTIEILHEKENFIRMSRLSKSQEKEDLFKLVFETKQKMDDIYENLNKQASDKEKMENFDKNRKLKRIYQLYHQYLSLGWGQYTNNKRFQEVSWSWIDLAVVTGLRDLIGFYQRSLKTQMPISPTLWLSTGKYN
ncbi:MAG: bacillithiol biosynthesis protein BshC [Candidatus Hodarchaeales archaeon]